MRYFIIRYEVGDLAIRNTWAATHPTYPPLSMLLTDIIGKTQEMHGVLVREKQVYISSIIELTKEDYESWIS